MNVILSLFFLFCWATTISEGYQSWTMLASSKRRPRSDYQYHPTVCSSASSSIDSKNNDKEESFDPTEHLSILNRNLKRLGGGKGLWERMGLSSSSSSSSSGEDEDNKEDGWEDEIHMNLRFALMSHGNVNGMDGPIHNYVNFGACSAFQLSRDAFLNVPACRVATPGVDQESWSMRLQNLRDDDTNNNIIDEYQGYRACLIDGRRFYIRDAVVWNCYTDNGDYYGQAILFDRQKVSYPEQQQRIS